MADIQYEPVGICTRPLIDGRITWAMIYNDCVAGDTIGPFGADEDEVVTLVAAIAPHLPANSYLHVDGYARRAVVHLLTQGQAVPRVDSRTRRSAGYYAERAAKVIPDDHIQLKYVRHLPLSFDPSAVAITALSTSAPSLFAWTCLTGAGWYITGLLQANHLERAHWLAAYLGISLYPRNSYLHLTGNYPSADRYLMHFIAGHQVTRPFWLPKSELSEMRDSVHRRTITIGTDEFDQVDLMQTAHMLCLSVADGELAPITTRPMETRWN